MAGTGLIDTDANFGITVKAVGRGAATPQLAGPNYYTMSGMENALNTANATYYTIARMAKMTKNDKIYALRFIQDAPSLSRG
jgi:Flp pilus assembly secretin CpaC